VFEFSRLRMSPGESSKSTERRPLSVNVSSAGPVASGPLSSRRGEHAGNPRELPDVTGFLVVVLVTLGLFVVPVGATIMQGPAIVASIFGR
jgi:hypothetical protein